LLGASELAAKFHECDENKEDERSEITADKGETKSAY
jgi:hypothetical protein